MDSASSDRPYGITLGDSSGIGPEIFLKAYSANQLPRPFRIFGDGAALEYYNDKLALHVQLSDFDIQDPHLLARDDIEPGRLSAKSGAAARRYVVDATNAALAGQIRAVVTLPINKEATQMTDPKFTGHTELIGELCGADDVTIMLVSDQLIVTHVSTHVSLKTAIERAKKERVLKIIELTGAAVARLRSNPRIAVAGLNPHAGENGLFGDEEIREIKPAIEAARQMGIPVEGPLAPDTLFYLAVQKKKYNAIVCMYHDQGHIPLKLLDFEGGVNVTLGLPIVRTSVDHGTAFDIAGKGIASTNSLLRAIELAVQLTAS
ncbi:MAG: 4-hydroxythreonine-4-phosphate dehydrogenase PdxA [Bryobacteraceae bacterium]